MATDTKTEVSKSSSQAQFVKIATEQGFKVKSEKPSGYRTDVTAVDPTYVDPPPGVSHRDVVESVVASFDENGRFLSGYINVAVRFSDDEVSKRRHNASKFGQVKGHVALGPKHKAEAKARQEESTRLSQEKQAADKVLLDAAATTDDIKSIKSQTGHDLRWAERSLVEALNSIVSEAEKALEDVKAGRKTGQSFGKLFGHSLDNAIEAHGKRNGLLELKWHLARMFGEEGIDIAW